MNETKLDAICDALKRADAKSEYTRIWVDQTGVNNAAIYGMTKEGVTKKLKAGFSGTAAGWYAWEEAKKMAARQGIQFNDPQPYHPAYNPKGKQ